MRHPAGRRRATEPPRLAGLAGRSPMSCSAIANRSVGPNQSTTPRTSARLRPVSAARVAPAETPQSTMREASTPCSAPCACSHASAASTSSSCAGKCASPLSRYSHEATAKPAATMRSNDCASLMPGVNTLRLPRSHPPPCRNTTSGAPVGIGRAQIERERAETRRLRDVDLEDRGTYVSRGTGTRA